MTRGRNLMLERRTMAKDRQDSHRNRHQRKATRESQGKRSLYIYQHVNSMREAKLESPKT